MRRHAKGGGGSNQRHMRGDHMHEEECWARENIQHTSRYLSSSWTVTALRGNERTIFHRWPVLDSGDI